MFKFNIIQETVFPFINSQELCVMLINDDGKFGLLVTTRTNFIAETKLGHRKMADKVFELLGRKLLQYATLEEATKIIRAGFMTRNEKQMVFVFQVLHSKFSLVDIGKMKTCFEFETEMEFENAEDEFTKDTYNPVAVKVFFQKKQIGQFNGHFKKPDFKFTLNQD